MPFKVGGKLDGLPEIVGRLSGLKLGVRNRILRGGVAKAARLLARRARALAPVDTTTAGLEVKGLYKKSITAKVMTYGGAVVAIIGAQNLRVAVRTRTRGGRRSAAGDPVIQNPAAISHLIEFGTAPHSLGEGSSLKKGRQSGTMHPGARAKPHLRPAWDGGKAEAERAIGDHVDAEVGKLVRKG